MADTQSDSQRGSNVIAYADGEPYFELTGDRVVYPIEVEQRGKTKHLHFHLSPYKPESMKMALNASSPLFVSAGAEAEVDSDLDIQSQFVKDHFLDVTNVAIDRKGTEAPAEVRQQLLAVNPDFYQIAWREGVCGIELIDPEGEEGLGDFVLIAQEEGASGHSIETRLELIDDDGSRVILNLVFHLEKESERDRRNYSKAQKTRVKLRGESGWRVVVNNDVIEMLFNKAAVRVEGPIRVKGAPCTKENKAEWIKPIPLFWKIVIINEIYRQVKVKNF